MAKLSPHCERIQIAGSIRRERPYVGDIEIVCIPKMDIYPTNGGEDLELRSKLFEKTVLSLGKITKGKPSNGRHVTIWLKEEIQVDLFITFPDIWGLMLAIRTGSADFSHNVLANKWVTLGYKSKAGVLSKNQTNFYIREETDLFRLLNMVYIHPKYRECSIR